MIYHWTLDCSGLLKGQIHSTQGNEMQKKKKKPSEVHQTSLKFIPPIFSNFDTYNI